MSPQKKPPRLKLFHWQILSSTNEKNNTNLTETLSENGERRNIFPTHLMRPA